MHVVLAVPGPDIRVTAADHTFAAAIRKVMKKLEQQIAGRKARRVASRNGNVRNTVRASFNRFAAAVNQAGSVVCHENSTISNNQR